MSEERYQTGGDDGEITARFEVQELVRGWHRMEEARPSVVPVVKVGLKTDLGRVRENNEDKAEFYEPEDPPTLAVRGSVYVVADGMGGHAAGQIASELAIKRTLTAYYTNANGDPGSALLHAIREANAYVFQVASAVPGRSGMGTTLTALALVEDRAYVGHIGDSRAYLIREGSIQQITEDHSWVAEQVRSGILTLDEAERSPYRNVITRCIGTAPDCEPDLFAVETTPGDTWVLCTDGLNEHVQDAEILKITGGQAPSEACRQLVELACSRGGHDNVTVLVVRVSDLVRWME